jgi:hypothetical protein
MFQDGAVLSVQEMTKASTKALAKPTLRGLNKAETGVGRRIVTLMKRVTN